MRLFYLLITTLFGIGYFPASGTFASLATLALIVGLHWYFGHFFFGALILVLVSFILGVVGSNYGEKKIFKEKDSGKIVIDEFCGMIISCLPITFLNWVQESNTMILIFYLVAFLLFRFFDISKIGIINRSQNLKGGYGVMMDDVLSGIFSAGIVLVILLTTIYLN